MKIICFLLFLLIFISGCSSTIKEVCFSDKCFSVEIADSESEKELGLMNRESLAENKGMLFIFDEDGIYNFWMKDTLIPLDIIWINSDKEVVYIKENALPCKNLFDEKDSLKNEQCETFIPDRKAKYVLEINAGKTKELGIKIGETAKFLNKS